MQPNSHVNANLDQRNQASTYLGFGYLTGVFFAVVLTPAVIFVAFLAYLSIFGNLLTPQRVENLFNNYYSQKENYYSSKYGHVVYNSADCIALGMMNLKPGPRSAVQFYIDSDLAYSSTGAGCDSLRDFYHSNHQVQVLSYYRYWSGYTVFVKSFLPFVSIPVFKIIIMSILFIALLIWNFSVVRTFCGIPKMSILFFSIIITSDFLDFETAFMHKVAYIALLLLATMVFFVSRQSLRIGFIAVCIASSLVTFFDALFVIPMLPGFLVMSVFSGNQYMKYRASMIESLWISAAIGLLSAFSVVAMQFFRLASVGVLSGTGLGGITSNISYFLHEDYGAKFSSSFHFGEVLRNVSEYLFDAKLVYVGLTLLGISLIIPSRAQNETFPSRAAQMCCLVAALSPLLWFLFFPAESFVHAGVIGYQIYYFVLVLAATAVCGLNLRWRGGDRHAGSGSRGLRLRPGSDRP